MTDSVTAHVAVSAYDIAQSLGIVYIVRELAAREPYGTPLQAPPTMTLAQTHRCAFCNQWIDAPHDPVCLWKRAKDIVDSGVLDNPAYRAIEAE